MSRTADRPETAASAVERAEKGRIERGTLNPGGRPKAVRELLDLARESVPDALAFAKKLLANETADDRVRLDAAKFLTAYGLGAAPKLSASDGSDDAASAENPARPLSTEDLIAIARASRPKPSQH